MTNDILAEEEIEEQRCQRQDVKMDRRIKTLELSLVNHNATTQLILEACRRIQWRWTKPETEIK